MLVIEVWVDLYGASGFDFLVPREVTNGSFVESVLVTLVLSRRSSGFLLCKLALTYWHHQFTEIVLQRPQCLVFQRSLVYICQTENRKSCTIVLSSSPFSLYKRTSESGYQLVVTFYLDRIVYFFLTCLAHTMLSLSKRWNLFFNKTSLNFIPLTNTYLLFLHDKTNQTCSSDTNAPTTKVLKSL